MKKRHIILAITLLISVIISCSKTENEIETSYLENSVEKLSLDPVVKWIVILPGLGCHGCIQEGEVFMQEHIDNKHILFVVTKIESLKILQKKTGINIKEHSNIYIDRKAEFNVPTDNTIYPCILQIEKGKVKAHEFQSPKNGVAFEVLKNRLLLEK